MFPRSGASSGGEGRTFVLIGLVSSCGVGISILSLTVLIVVSDVFWILRSRARCVTSYQSLLDVADTRPVT